MRVGRVRRRAAALLVLAALLGVAAVSGCLGSEPAKVMVGATILSGPAGPTAGTSQSDGSGRLLVDPALPIGLVTSARDSADGDGHEWWVVTPNRMELTIQRITFFQSESFEDTQSIASDSDFPGGCTFTIERGQKSLQPLASCPASVTVGTYHRVEVRYRGTYRMQIDDHENHLYTDHASPTKVSRVRPAAGGEMLDFGHPTDSQDGAFSVRARLAEPFVVQVNGTAPLFIVANILQQVGIQVAGGSAWVTAENDTMSPPPVNLLPTVHAGAIDFYSPAPNAANFNRGPEGKVLLLAILYSRPGSVERISFSGGSTVLPASPCDTRGTSGEDPTSGQVVFSAAESRAGVDAERVLAFAAPTKKGEGFWAYYRLPLASQTGAQSTLECERLHGAPAPVPADGRSYGSGAPAISAPSDRILMTLVAT